METVLIVGCGYVGQRVAEHLMRAKRTVSCTVSSEESAAALSVRGFGVQRLNLDAPEGFVPPMGPYQLLYLVPPPRNGRHDSRICTLLDLVSEQLPSRFVYCSSSAVYGDRKGDWVDESATIEVQNDTASRRIDAEKSLERWSSTSGVTNVTLRVAGIYGPDRLPLDRLRSGRPAVFESEAGWSNRIHVDDLADVCVAVLDHASPRPLYNVADGHPTTTTAFLRAVAKYAGLPPLPEISLSDALVPANAEQARFLRESRRLDVTRMCEDLLPELSFPDFHLALRSHQNV